MNRFFSHSHQRYRCMANLKLSPNLCNFSTTSIRISAPTVKQFINGNFIESSTKEFIDFHNPATNEVIYRVPKSTPAEIEMAVLSAKEAFKSWSQTSILTRQRTLLRFLNLVNENKEKLRIATIQEQESTFQDAEKEVMKGIEYLEHACCIANLQLGETLRSVSRSTDVESFKLPLGVCAGITPFNATVPGALILFPLALATGNTMILKPSEQGTAAVMSLMELAKRAGIPDGCVNVTHGDHEAATYLCDNPDIRAITFIGSSEAGKYIYERGSKSGKRVQCFMSVNNIGVIMPDAKKEDTLKKVLVSSFSTAGQRCSRLACAVFVGNSKNWIPELVERAKELKVNAGHIPNTNFGPIISAKSKEKIIKRIDATVEDGAKLALDGRFISVPGFEKGNFIGPTVLTGVTADMPSFKEEIYGPVLKTITADTIDDAIEIIKKNPYGHCSLVFTTSGASARKFIHEIEVGMIGVNVPNPVPPAMFSFSGMRGSFLGDSSTMGKTGVNFYTQLKMVTQCWREQDA